MITTSFSTVQQSVLNSSMGFNQSLDVCIMAESTTNPSVYFLRVDTMDGLKIGYVNKEMCVALSPLLKNLTIEASIPKLQTVVYHTFHIIR